LPTDRPHLLRAWWPAILWIGLISFESTDYLSAQNTATMLYDVLTRLFGEIDLYDFLYWHHYLRKTGHVLGYGMLCLLMLRGWRATLGRASSWDWRSGMLAWVGTAFVGSLDEWHQTFIPSRTGTIRDFILDGCAGLGFLLLAYFWLRRPGSVEQRS
jgi:VanZ family protein